MTNEVPPSPSKSYWRGFSDGEKAERERQQSTLGRKLEAALMGEGADEWKQEEVNHADRTN